LVIFRDFFIVANSYYGHATIVETLIAMVINYLNIGCAC